MFLDNKTQELIAIGAAVAANCQPCLEYHACKALESGADELEIKEAVETGRTVRKGAASKMDKFASSLSKPVHLTSEADDSCGCGN